MAKMRVNLFFSDIRGKGWSETYYNMSSSYTLTLTQAKVLADKRRQINGQGVFLEEIRVSDDEVKNDSMIYALPSADQISQYISSAGDVASTALLVRAMSGFQTRRPLYLSGVPDDYTTANGLWTPSTVWQSNYNDFRTELISRRWGIKAILTLQPPNVSVFRIAAMSQNLVTGNTLVQTTTPHNFSPGDLINILGVKGAGGVRGRHVCGSLTVPATTGFDIPNTFILGTPTVFGFAQKVSFVLREIDDATIERVTHRIRGLPFDHSRGRR